MNRKGGVARWARYQYVKLLRINDTPEKIAGGLALGVAIGILPSFGLGIIVAVFVAALIRVNKVSALIGTLIMNPWTAPFFWGVSYLAGSLMLGNDLSGAISVVRELKGQGDLWENLLAKRLLLPYIAGNAVVTAASAAFSYVACIYTVRTYRRAKARRRAGKTKMNY
jgi:uncharacterized protein